MNKKAKLISMIPTKIPEDITEADETLFFKITSTDLTSSQRHLVRTPTRIYPQQRYILGVHWHPEFIPLNDIRKRIETTFPNREQELIIPTQHNKFTTYGRYSGVEVDCYASGFKQKVQLLLHFEAERIKNCTRLCQILTHTQKHRSGQLFDVMHTIINAPPDRINPAARQSRASADLVSFVRQYVIKIQTMLERYEQKIAPEQIKNKLLRNFFDELRPLYGDTIIDRCQTYLKAVKKIVKSNFSISYFYRASEVIEEVRGLGGGVVIPHPELFWPILLRDYDVDGVEVWNPQSYRYTEFLISIIHNKNQSKNQGHPPLLIFMGDDTHFGEKIRNPKLQNREKATREVGIQPAWNDFMIRKALIWANTDRKKTIEAYKARLAG